EVVPDGRSAVVVKRPVGVGVAARGVIRLDVDPHSEPDDHVTGSTGTGVADHSRSRGRAEVLAVPCLVFKRVLAGRRLYAELARLERGVVLQSDALQDIGNGRAVSRAYRRQEAASTREVRLATGVGGGSDSRPR